MCKILSCFAWIIFVEYNKRAKFHIHFVVIRFMDIFLDLKYMLEYIENLPFAMVALPIGTLLLVRYK